MERESFNISFEYNNMQYKGWFMANQRSGTNEKPSSFHVVLNDIFFGNMSFNNGKWNVDQQRPEELIEITGRKISETLK